MDATIAAALAQDGIVNGAVYALLALSLVLVFAVTRVVFIPQGELVAFGALTYAALETRAVPGSVWLLPALGLAAAIRAFWAERGEMTARGAAALLIETLAIPGAIAGAVALLAPLPLGPAAHAAMAVAVVTPMAPLLYRIAFESLADASVLVLLIAAVGAHLAVSGLGLVVFGPEGSRANPFSPAVVAAGDLVVPAQAFFVVGAAAALIAALTAFFALTLTGRALRATAVNRLGARLVGIPARAAGRIAFTLAGLIGAASGVLTAPLTTIYYDSGFLIGLKGFVAAIVGGMASYPVAALAAIGVGLTESFASFWASAFKEVIVFALIVPVLLARSLGADAAGAEDEE
jgi:branched-chain amino acid transport system permease protein